MPPVTVSHGEDDATRKLDKVLKVTFLKGLTVDDTSVIGIKSLFDKSDSIG